MRIARVVGFVGRGLVLAGLLLLFYTGYLLVGTNVYTRNAQDHLTEQLQRSNPTAPVVEAGDIKPARPATKPNPGDPLFTIVIPKIGLKTVVVEGVDPEQLKKGPGHFPDHPWPGEDGNVPISGHRTTFGAPFFRLNELAPGDTIAIESGPARYRYTVSEQQIVTPDRVDVVENRGRNELTLTTCNPRFSAAQRLIIHAQYDGPELIAGAEPANRPEPGPGVKTGERELVPAPPPAVPRDVLALALLAVTAALAAMALSKRLRVAAIWSAITISVGIGLWTAVFPQVLRLMPANY